MPEEKVTRIFDHEKRSRNPDAAGPRDITEADVIVLPYDIDKLDEMKRERGVIR